jgi:hypothetical protein
MEENKGFYTGNGKNDTPKEPDWLAKSVGYFLLICIILLAGVGTIKLISMMLGA